MSRLQVKIADYEFQAEGDELAVRASWRRFYRWMLRHGRKRGIFKPARKRDPVEKKEEA